MHERAYSTGNAGDAGADGAAGSVVLRAGICVSDEGIGLQKTSISKITCGDNDY